MADFVRERAIIEDVYAKSLAKLAASIYGDQEEGTLGRAWKHLKTKLQEEASAHQAFAVKLVNKVQKPIQTKVAEEQKADKKMHDQFKDLLHEDRKAVSSSFALVEKARESVAEKQKAVGEKEITAQQSSKALDKYEKAVKKTVQAGHGHRKAVETYNASQRKWVDDMVSACSTLEKQEVDRVEFTKKQIMLYVFLRKEVNEICEKAMEEIVSKVDEVDAHKDRKLFIDKCGTGSLRPVDMP
ncbi:Hypothetical predicted protein [Paramuricea clavata]|nr:Hypothetical predicted protein [Paramuricea clavata]